MLKKHYVDFLGTDIHRVDNTSVIDNFSKIEKKIIHETGESYYRKMKENSDKLTRHR